MDEDLKNLLETIRQENAAAHADSGHLFRITADGLRHQLQIVAEGVSSATLKIERLDAKIDRLFSELDLRVTRLEAARRR